MGQYVPDRLEPLPIDLASVGRVSEDAFGSQVSAAINNNRTSEELSEAPGFVRIVGNDALTNLVRFDSDSGLAIQPGRYAFPLVHAYPQMRQDSEDRLFKFRADALLSETELPTLRCFGFVGVGRGVGGRNPTSDGWNTNFVDVNMIFPCGEQISVLPKFFAGTGGRSVNFRFIIFGIGIYNGSATVTEILQGHQVVALSSYRYNKELSFYDVRG